MARPSVRLFRAGAILVGVGLIVWALGGIVFRTTSNNEPFMPFLDEQAGYWLVTGTMIMLGLHAIVAGVAIIARALRPRLQVKTIVPFMLVGGAVPIIIARSVGISTIDAWTIEASSHFSPDAWATVAPALRVFNAPFLVWVLAAVVGSIWLVVLGVAAATRKVAAAA